MKGIEYEYRPVHLLKDGGEQVRWIFLCFSSTLSVIHWLFLQLADSYKAINPQCEVPTLLIDGHTLSQSVSQSVSLST